MIRHVFFDFNGTIIDDLDICLDILNLFLREQGKKELDVDEYKHVFKFPIEDYYRDAGLDFTKSSYNELSLRFIKDYQPRSMDCGLFDGIYDAVKRLKEEGYHTYILSASEQKNLLEQTDHYKLTPLFDAVLGITDIHAASKVQMAVNYMKKTGIKPSECVFIGDTLHDKETAEAMGVSCVLVSWGHQARDVLEEAGVPVIDSVDEIFSHIH